MINCIKFLLIAFNDVILALFIQPLKRDWQTIEKILLKNVTVYYCAYQDAGCEKVFTKKERRIHPDQDVMVCKNCYEKNI